MAAVVQPPRLRRRIPSHHRHCRVSVIASPFYLQNRTPLTKQNIATWPNGTFLFFPTPLAMQAADPELGNAFSASNRDYLLIQNTGSAVRTVTIHSYPEPQFNRRGELVVTIDPGQITLMGPIPKLGYAQLDGNIWLNAPAADVMLLPLTFS